MPIFTLHVDSKAVTVGEHDEVAKYAKLIGRRASVKAATANEIQTLPGIKTFTGTVKHDPKPVADAPVAVLAPAAEGVGAGMGYMPESEAKTKAVHRNFARAALYPSSGYRLGAEGKVRFATEYHGIHATRYIYGPKEDVLAEVEKVYAKFPAAGYGTLTRDFDTFEGDSWYALVTHSLNSD